MAEQQADGSDQSNLLSLKWNNHLSNFKVVIASLQEKSVLSDATLACDGQLFPVHKLVLSTCSEFFGRVFSSTPCKHPVIVLQDLQPRHLHYLLSYMYVGEVNVPQAHLPTLIRAAETLQIKGLAAPDEEPPPIQGSTQPRLAESRNRNDYYSPNQNTGRDLLNKSAGSNKSSAKRRRCYSVEHQEEITDCVEYSKDGGRKDNNSGDLYEKRLNPLNAKQSRKANSDNDTGQEYTNKKNCEKFPLPTDVKEETPSKSSPIEQVGPIKEECDFSGSDDVTSLEEGMGGWGDEQGTVDWACSSGQHEGSATTMPWIPFSSPSSLSAQDCEATAGYTSSAPTSIAMDTTAPSDGEYNTLTTLLTSTTTVIHGKKSTGEGRHEPHKEKAPTSPPIASPPAAASPLIFFNNHGSASDVKGLSISMSSSVMNKLAERRIASDNSNSVSTSYCRGNNSSNCNIQPSSNCNLLPLQTAGGVGGMYRQWLCPYPLCGYATDRESWLKTHLRKHTGERPFQCPHCPYRSAQKSNLTVHVKKVHNKDKQQQQRGGCGSVFSFSSFEDGLVSRENSISSLIKNSSSTVFNNSIRDWGGEGRRKSVDSSDVLLLSSHGKHFTPTPDKNDSIALDARNLLLKNINNDVSIEVGNGKGSSNINNSKRSVEHKSPTHTGSSSSLVSSDNSNSQNPRGVVHFTPRSSPPASSNTFSNCSGQPPQELLETPSLDGALLGVATPSSLTEQQQQHHLQQLLQHQLGFSHPHHFQEYHH